MNEQFSGTQLPSPGETPAGAEVPTQDERTMATLAHVLQLIGWWIAPLVILLVKKESRFVSFHALQALLLQILHMMVIGVFMVSWFALIFSTVVLHPGPQGALPPAIFLVFPLIWLVFMGLWVLLITLAIVYGVKAGRGEWAEYPLLGRLARRILGIGPNGRVIA